MENLFNYLKANLLTLQGVEQVDYIDSQTKLDELKERKFTFVAVVFGSVVNNSNQNEVIETTLIFENKCDEERKLLLKELDVIKRIINEFKSIMMSSDKYLFPAEWTLNQFDKLSTDKTIGFRIDLDITIPNKKHCATTR